MTSAKDISLLFSRQSVKRMTLGVPTQCFNFNSFSCPETKILNSSEWRNSHKSRHTVMTFVTGVVLTVS